MVSSRSRRRKRRKRGKHRSKREPLGKRIMVNDLETKLSRDKQLAKLGVYDQLENREEYYSDPDTGSWKRIDLVLVHRINHKNNTEEVEKRRAKFEKSLEEAGIKLIRVKGSMKSRDQSVKIFTLCTVENHKLMDIIARFNWKMPVKKTDYTPRKYKPICKCLAPLEYPQKPAEFDAYKYFRAPFTKTKMALFPIEKMGVDNFVTDNERSRIAEYIVSHTEQPLDLKQKQFAEKMGKDFTPVIHLGFENLFRSHLYTDIYSCHTGPYTWTKEMTEKYGPWKENVENLSYRQQLHYSWSGREAFFKYQPLEEIRRYFGEKTGLYFAWLGFYSRWMFAPALFGLAVFLTGFILLFFDAVVIEGCSNKPRPDFVLCPTCDFCDFSLLNSACQQVKFGRLLDNPLTILMAFFISIWSVLALEFWRREQNCYGFEWDLFSVTGAGKIIRPEYLEFVRTNYAKTGDKRWRRINPVDGKSEYAVPKKIRIFRRFFSYGIVCLILSAIFGLFSFLLLSGGLLTYLIDRNTDSESVKSQAGNISYLICTVFTVVFIEVLNCQLSKLCHKITRFEQHRTQSEFERSYCYKMFAFQFMNNYSAIIYLAFFKSQFVGYPGEFSRVFGQRQEQCGLLGCMTEVAFELAIIMIILEAIANVREIGTIFCRNRRLRKRHVNKIELEKGAIACWEADFYLTGQDSLQLFDEYLQQIIQFGFASLFATAFPLAPFIAFLNACLEIKLDAFKFVTQLRRPIPEKIKNIGAWFNILQTIAILSVLTNACILAFTSHFLAEHFYKYGNYDPSWDYGFQPNHNMSLLDFVTSRTNWNLVEDPVDTKLAKACKGICRYPGMRYPDKHPNHLEVTSVYWHLLALRLGFVFLFENLVVLVFILIKVCIPHMPQSVMDQQQKEDYVGKQKLNPTLEVVEQPERDDGYEELS